MVAVVEHVENDFVATLILGSLLCLCCLPIHELPEVSTVQSNGGEMGIHF
jgi:hypothetical protein